MRKFSPILQIYQVIYKYLQLNFGAAEQNLKSRRKGNYQTGQNVAVLNVETLPVNLPKGSFTRGNFLAPCKEMVTKALRGKVAHEPRRPTRRELIPVSEA